MTWAVADTRRAEVSTPLASRASISEMRTPRSMTTPLPMTGVQPGVRMPEGRRWRAYLSPSMTTVCPALLPPLYLTT